MQINAGQYRGLKLIAPPASVARPTSDRARQAIFNILLHNLLPKPQGLSGLRILDAFAGSGALGLEAISRGALSLLAFEIDPSAIDAIKRNAARFQNQAAIRILALDARRPPAAKQFPGFSPCDLIFLDPPYGKNLVNEALLALQHGGWLAPTSLIVAEMDQRDEFHCPKNFEIRDERRYGKARFLFLQSNS